jgi:N,N'-diacetyllegionaminate synthase
MRDIAEIFDSRGRPFLIAEVGLGHDGSLGMAHAYIDAVANTGADAIKFQTHIAEAESSPKEPFRVKFSYQDATRYGYWERTSFTIEQWAGLKLHAEEKCLVFLSTPFSVQAVDLLETLEIVAWKISSGEFGSRRMLERIGATGKPVLASTGMSTMEEVETLVATLQKITPKQHAVLQCTTEYPTPPAHVGMNIFDDYRARFDCPIGLSDHSGTVWPSLIAASRGARVLEVHVTMSRQMFGPDVSSSLTIEQLTELAHGLDFVHTMLSSPLDKDVAAAAKAPLRKLFGKSAMAVREMQLGEVPDEESVSFRKPGTGLDESEFDALAGRPLVRAVAAGTFLQKEDFQ